jgi:alpha-mannosidase
MTSRNFDPRFDHHPHLPDHGHDHAPTHAHVHAHMHAHTPPHDQSSPHGLTRRGFLFTSAATTAGLLLVRLERVIGRPILLPTTPSKRIYIALDDHTDYFWTADDTTYRTVFLQTLDYYLDNADSTAGNDAPYQSRWNCDGTLWVWEYQHNRSAAQFQRLTDRIRDGHISVPLNPLCVVLGGVPAEAVLRGAYYAGQLERRYNLKFTLAYAMENQTLPYGIGALWAGAGAKYSWKGICGCASQVPDAWDREHDIYWWVGPDGSKLLMKWNSQLTHESRAMGGYAEAYDPNAVVDYVDSDSGFIARFAYAVIGAFGKGWDGLQTLTQDFVAVAQAKTNADRQVIVSNEHDFFEDFEANYGTSLPNVACTFGNEWELYVASLAEASARVKRAVEKLHGAEAMATLVSLKQPTFMTGREAARDQAFLDLGLYWEHCWTADGPNVTNAQRRDWQRKLVNEIEAYVNLLYSDAVSALGGLIQKSGSNTRFFVFNPLSWARTDIADYAYSGSPNVHVIDVAAQQEVPSQLVTMDNQTYLRILASDVPPVGYKVFEIQSGASTITNGGPTASVGVSSGMLENEIYQVTVAARGAITSLIDKARSNQEFAQTFGGYVINDLGSSTGTLTVENAGPVSATLTAAAASPVAHTTRITLIRGLNRIDIRNQITQNFNTVLKWRFGFNLTSPDMWHEEVGAIIRAKLTTSGGHYSPRNARYDWLTLNRFADMSGGGAGITLANADCYYMQLGSSTTSSLDTTTSQISVLAGGQVDGTNYGITSQGGDTSFLQRFALRTHDAYDPAAAMRVALEMQNPLITGMITGGSTYPADQFSLLTISNANVLISAVKPADDGIANGIVVRVWNLSNSAASCALSLPGDEIASAQHLTHIETPVEALPVTSGVVNDTLAAQQLKTYVLLPQSSLAQFSNHTYVPLVKK